VNGVPASMRLPHERARGRVRGLVLALMAALGLLVVTVMDGWVWRSVTLPREVFAVVERRDWYQLFRQVGYVPLWVIVAVCFWCVDRGVRGPRRGLLVLLSAGLGGAAAEVVKAIVQRYRPGMDGEYAFRWGTGEIPNAHLIKGLGLASSHAGVAFGGAFMLGLLFPRLAYPLFVVAVLCSMTRLVSGAHFLSDVYVAGVLSYCVARGVWKLGGGSDSAEIKA